MAARSLMRKLHQEGEITLPAARRPATNAQRGREAPPLPAVGLPLACSLRELRPIRLELILPQGPHRDLFFGYLAHYHYLGWRSRNDRQQTLRVPIKDVYVCPLSRWFRQRLGVDG